MRQAAKRNPGQFTKGNTARVKERWTDERLAAFQRDLKATRERLGFTPAEMGQAMGFGRTYVPLIEGHFTEKRQPSQRFVERFEELKATAQGKIDWRIPASIMKALAKVTKRENLWAHVLAKKFICPECRKEVKRGERIAGYDVWWSRTPSQKHCPQHQPNRNRRKRK